MLEGRDVLGTGLGLGAFRLILLFIDGSFIELGLPVVAVTLLAREGRRADTALATGGAA